MGRNSTQCNIHNRTSKQSKIAKFFKKNTARWRRHQPIKDDDRGGLNAIPNKYTSGWME